ncbi:MAG: ATP-binding cassette domain-containing protein, partial [Clostridiales bacterium]|nr:ATP-binding cassette domain-containing protein [Clostridiales bacterium]
AFSNKKMQKMRPKMQIIFQDPYSSLNPRLTVGEIVGEALKTHGMVRSKAGMTERVHDMLEKCGLSDYHIERYPHEFSGGQRQRICIARALVLRPKFVVCDEAVSALDVSVQSQILNLLCSLKKDRGLSYLFIAHGLHVVHHISDRVAVMYLGQIVESASADEVFASPRHPYTEALVSAVPDPENTCGSRIVLSGDIPSLANPPSGCRFHTRCRYAQAVCSEAEPVLSEGAHPCACHFPLGGR